MNSSVLLDVQQGVATVTLNRGQARNALNMQVKRRLADVIAEVGDRGDVRALILTGAGGSFCAGGDIAEMELNDSPVTSRARLARLLHDVVIPLSELELPTVAAVQGHAHGAGLSLALACDLLVVAEDATLSCAFAKMGLIPDCAALYFLPRRLPLNVAKELVLTGRRFSGSEAAAMGLANRAVAPESVGSVAAALAAELAAGATVALGLSKRLLEDATSMSIHQMAQLEALGQAVAYSTQDHTAARAAFRAKATAAFTGR